MILLEIPNRALVDTIKKAFTAEKRSALDIALADFDGVLYHITANPQQRNLLTISMRWGCAAECKQYGADAKIREVYGNKVTSTENGYDFSLLIDLDAVTSPEEQDKLATEIGKLKRHVIAAPFGHVFDAVNKGGAAQMATVRYRDHEALYIKPEGDRVTVIFSINFSDKDDIVISNVFLSELANVRKQMTSAPGVMFFKEPPLELKGVSGVHTGDDQGFVSFALFKGHTQPVQREKVIDMIHLFRDYLHYHIKCSKAYLHTRMRNRVESLLQVLNRAKMKSANKEKKKFGGQTFKRS
ncbi:Actin-related protein 2/3 complex subunit 2 [Balamuthia mandrillaris]